MNQFARIVHVPVVGEPHFTTPQNALQAGRAGVVIERRVDRGRVLLDLKLARVPLVERVDGGAESRWKRHRGGHVRGQSHEIRDQSRLAGFLADGTSGLVVGCASAGRPLSP